MKIEVKICGLSDPECVEAAVDNGARYLGFVFYPKSRRAIDAARAASLLSKVPPSIKSVGLFVDPSDEDIENVLKIAPLSMIQLHGSENPARVAAVKKLTKLPVIKAIGVAKPQDLDALKLFEPVADLLLIDAKSANDIPGGQGVPFDWSLVRDAAFSKPWFLAGGLNEGNIEAAVKTTKARILDVSSGVEDAAGHKNPQKIRAFLKKAMDIETCY